MFETNGGNTLDGNDSITVTTEGTVGTSGNFAYGLSADGSNNTLTNSGAIATSGSVASGLDAFFGGDNILTNSGTITTSGSYSHGLSAGYSNNTLTNNGAIATSNDNAHGLYASLNDNILTNSGTITTSGSSSSGLLAFGLRNTLANSGTITTTGDFADGLSVDISFADSYGNTLTNSGTITTSGDFADGLYAGGLIGENNGNTLTNSGTIITSGTDSEGIFTSGDGNRVTNSGRIQSEQSSAIEMFGSDATLTLAEGSILQGDVFFSDGETATLNFEENLSAVVRLSGEVPATITAPNDAYAVDGDTVYVVNTRDFATPDQTIGFVGKLTLNALEGRSAQPRAEGSAEDASVGAEVWVQTFGGRFEDDGNSDREAYDSWTAGVLVGRDTGDSRGFFLGAAFSELDSDNDFELDTDHVLGGVYAGYVVGTMEVDASLTVGAARNSSERRVANNLVESGVETVTADYNSLFIMPAATFKGDWGMSAGTLTPSLRIRYAAIWHESYSEDGTGPDLDVDSRISHLVDARLQLEHAFAPYVTDTGTLFSSFRFGVEGQYLDQDNVDASVASSPIGFAAGDDESSARGFISLDVRHLSRNEDSEFVASIATGRTTSDLTDVSGFLGWNMRF